ncbi:MAG: InlB B-repeat-containing protein [Treponema sp.]
MKRSNSTKKAQSAFRKLGAVVLITATLAMCFTACNQTGNTGGGGGKPTPPPPPKPKHAITFSVEGTNGTLKAKADGVDETSTSPINVEAGKTVTFTATANSGYRVKGWILDGNAITEAGTNTEYKLKVSEPATVKVSFEAIPPTKYTVTLTQTEGGKVTASPEIPADKLMPKDTEITFTATANEGYKIGKWTVTGSTLEAGTGADGSETAKVKITADTTISVSFEVTSVEGSASLILSPDKLTIKVRAKTADGSLITVEGCTETTLKSNRYTELHAKRTKVIIKGKITELYCWNNQLTELNMQGLTSLQKLYCWDNQLTALNVQGLTSLQELSCSYNQLIALNVQGCASLKKLICHVNQLNAQAMTEVLNALPARVAGDDAKAILYTERTDENESNCKDFSQPADLKKAFEDATSKNWKLRKNDASGSEVDI